MQGQIEGRERGRNRFLGMSVDAHWEPRCESRRKMHNDCSFPAFIIRIILSNCSQTYSQPKTSFRFSFVNSSCATNTHHYNNINEMFLSIFFLNLHLIRVQWYCFPQINLFFFFSIRIRMGKCSIIILKIKFANQLNNDGSYVRDLHSQRQFMFNLFIQHKMETNEKHRLIRNIHLKIFQLIRSILYHSTYKDWGVFALIANCTWISSKISQIFC